MKNLATNKFICKKCGEVEHIVCKGYVCCPHCGLQIEPYKENLTTALINKLNDLIANQKFKKAKKCLNKKLEGNRYSPMLNKLYFECEIEELLRKGYKHSKQASIDVDKQISSNVHFQNVIKCGNEQIVSDVNQKVSNFKERFESIINNKTYLGKLKNLWWKVKSNKYYIKEIVYVYFMAFDLKDFEPDKKQVFVDKLYALIQDWNKYRDIDTARKIVRHLNVSHKKVIDGSKYQARLENVLKYLKRDIEKSKFLNSEKKFIESFSSSLSQLLKTYRDVCEHNEKVNNFNEAVREVHNEADIKKDFVIDSVNVEELKEDYAHIKNKEKEVDKISKEVKKVKYESQKLENMINELMTSISSFEHFDDLPVEASTLLITHHTPIEKDESLRKEEALKLRMINLRIDLEKLFIFKCGLDRGFLIGKKNFIKRLRSKDNAWEELRTDEDMIELLSSSYSIASDVMHFNTPKINELAEKDLQLINRMQEFINKNPIEPNEQQYLTYIINSQYILKKELRYKLSAKYPNSKLIYDYIKRKWKNAEEFIGQGKWLCVEDENEEICKEFDNNDLKNILAIMNDWQNFIKRMCLIYTEAIAAFPSITNDKRVNKELIGVADLMPEEKVKSINDRVEKYRAENIYNFIIKTYESQKNKGENNAGDKKEIS